MILSAIIFPPFYLGSIVKVIPQSRSTLLSTKHPNDNALHSVNTAVHVINEIKYITLLIP